MSSNDNKIRLIEDVINYRKLVPKSVELMNQLSEKYYREWKSEIDKITVDKECSGENIQLSDSLKANTNKGMSTEELQRSMITTLKVLEIMLENKKSRIAQIIDKD